MQDPAGTFTDGPLVFGSQTTQFGGGGATFIADEIDIEQDADLLQSKNQNGVVTKQAGISKPLTGTLTLSLPNGTTAAPAQFATFTLTPIGGGSAINFFVKKVGQRSKSDGEAKVPVEFVQKLN